MSVGPIRGETMITWEAVMMWQYINTSFFDDRCIRILRVCTQADLQAVLVDLQYSRTTVRSTAVQP